MFINSQNLTNNKFGVVDKYDFGKGNKRGAKILFWLTNRLAVAYPPVASSHKLHLMKSRTNVVQTVKVSQNVSQGLKGR